MAGGVKLIEDLRLIRVRLPRRQASSVALLTMIALFFVAAAVMAYGFPLTPPLVLGGWLLAGVLAGGGSVYGWFFVVARSGREDLVIDEGSRTIRLPLTYGRRLETRLGFAEFAAVVLDKIEHQGRRGSTYYTYAVLLEKKDGILERLIELNQSRAEGLAEWLKAKLGIGGGGGVQTLNREANDE